MVRAGCEHSEYGTLLVPIYRFSIEDGNAYSLPQ